MTEKNSNIHKKIDRYLNGVYLRKEVDSLKNDLKRQDHLEYLDACSEKIWEESLETDPPTPYSNEKDEQEARRLLFRIQKKTYSIRPLLKIAACLALIASTSWGLLYIGNSSSTEEVLTELYVAYGDKKEIKLPDGTIAILNAGTKIKYPIQFKGEERRVELSGEAFFAVTKDAKHPFVVISQQLKVKVLGTKFNIKVYNQDEQASVSVKSGKVQVETNEVVSQLVAGEQIRINTVTKDYRKEREDFDNASSWIKGGLFFNESPLKDVVKELSRIYNCTIRFEEGQSFDNLIIGGHDNKHIESVLKSIEYTTGIKYKKEGEDFILYK